MRSTFKVLFYVKKGSDKPNGNLSLMCRLTVDGEIKQFSCKMDVSLRLWDVKNLTADRLQTFFDGNLWIITRRKKTNTESNIRLLDVSKRIIEKYKGLARDGHVFPVPSNGSCNKILKEIGRQCGFKVRLTYHMSRHTNTTTVLLSHGVPIEMVSRLLGHTNIKTTQIYTKITAQKISQDMETLSHKLEEPTDTVRLCADDIMTRLKLKSYQDTYAEAMAKYGLQRGIDGSKARHKSTQQYYNETKKLADSLKAEVVDLQQQKGKRDTDREAERGSDHRSRQHRRERRFSFR